MGRANQPRDLVWSLENFQSPDNAMRFFQAFKNSFLIYSSSVEKIYSEYTTHLTGPIGLQRLVVLPDFTKYESIFNRVNTSAVVDTSVQIYPRIEDGHTKLMVSGISTTTGELEKLPLRQGLKAMKIGYFDKRKIFPALMLGDLREFPEKRLPYLRLHTIVSDQLEELSEFEQKDITNGAWDKLDHLF